MCGYYLLKNKMKKSVINLVKEKGVRYLSDKELVGIIIGGNTPGDSLNKSLIKLPDSLTELAKMELSDLESINISTLKSVQIMATFELSKRKLEEENEGVVLNSTQRAVNLFKPRLMDLKHEEFHVAFVGRKLKIIKYMEMFKGGTDATTVDPKVIIKHAFSIGGVYGILCAHNHPSEDPTPSEADRKITRKIQDICNIADIRFLDHIIIAGNKYYSFQS